MPTHTATMPEANEALAAFQEANRLLLTKLDGWASPRAPAAQLYATGWLTKLRQGSYSLQQLALLISHPKAEEHTSTDELLSYSQRISFHNDCFWTFTYATYDIAAQIINQVEGLGLNESAVGFRREMVNQIGNDGIRVVAQRVLGAPPFTTLNRYRNTSLHRRDICIQWRREQRVLTGGYTATTGTDSETLVAEWLCDDPFTTAPTFGEQRPVLGYCAYCFAKTAKELKNLATKIKKAI